MSKILQKVPLGFPWATVDPFLFCVHHEDAYPEGNDALGPDPKHLAGRNIGQDFEGKDGWRMYHGDVVPGFPQHPHRGFETVTIVRRGFIDHSDSLGATARFGRGDTQWLTAGAGIVHCEMFPLIEKAAPNPVELFQIWLNLPSDDKMAPPHFAMLWAEDTPRVRKTDAAGKNTDIVIIAGELDGKKPAAPPPHSWAARMDSHVAIWTIAMDPGATWTLPRAPEDAVRTLYFFVGKELDVDGEKIAPKTAAIVESAADITLVAGDAPVEILLLQGRPIGEPVVQHGPFVMNTRLQIQNAIADYQRTRFGGWPYSSDAPVHPRDRKRFALHADGHHEERK